MKVLIETSARHVHLCKKDLYTLFGNNYNLTIKKDLSQPGQFCCNEKVSIVGPKGIINNVSILGPERPYTQVEISLTDARKLGINTCVRESSDIDNTSGCKISGPCGEIDIDKGVIIAKRHIHMNTDDAKKFGFKNHQIVSVKVESCDRSLTFSDVVIRVSDSFCTAMHIDTDEANAACISGATYGEIIS